MKEWTKEEKKRCELKLFEVYGIKFNIQRSGSQKRKRTLIERYGTIDYLNALGIMKEREKKRKATCVKRYGVECITKTKEHIDKAKKTRKTTLLKKYGITSPMQVEEFKKKNQESVKKTSLERYGFDHILRVPKFKLKSIKACRELPTEPEKILIGLLKPFKFKYTGDFKKFIRIEGGIRFPDFLREKDKKIVECFGDYFHKREDETKKVSEYKEVGYDCLIVWASELKDLDKVKEKVLHFLEPVETIHQAPLKKNQRKKT